jgi:hypothetical protein
MPLNASSARHAPMPHLLVHPAEALLLGHACATASACKLWQREACGSAIGYSCGVDDAGTVTALGAA